MRSLTPEEADYSKRLFDAVLDLVIGMDADPSGQGGFVRPDIARMTLADVAAMMDQNCGIGQTPRERRNLGDDISKRYVKMRQSLSTAPAMQRWLPATREDEAPGGAN